MAVEIPVSGRVQGILGEDRSARQFRDRKGDLQMKSRPGAHSHPLEPDPAAADLAEPEATAGEDGDLALGTANGQTLADVKAVYESS